MRMVSALVVLTLALGACGGGTAGESTKRDAATATASTSASSYPTRPTATTEQYASLITRSDIQFRTMNDCDWLGSGRLDFSSGSITCQAGLLSTSYASRLLVLTLKGASDLSSSDYIGDPPTEIAALVGETISKAHATDRAMIKAFNNHCADSARGKCVDLRIDAWMALGDLETSMKAWKPYI